MTVTSFQNVPRGHRKRCSSGRLPSHHPEPDRRQVSVPEIRHAGQGESTDGMPRDETHSALSLCCPQRFAGHGRDQQLSAIHKIGETEAKNITSSAISAAEPGSFVAMRSASARCPSGSPPHHKRHGSQPRRPRHRSLPRHGTGATRYFPAETTARTVHRDDLAIEPNVHIATHPLVFPPKLVAFHAERTASAGLE
jgi:hypothetical protein